MDRRPVVSWTRCASRISPSLGGTESLVGQPALLSCFDANPEYLDAIGIRPELVRLCLGIEATGDLLADLDGVVHGMGMSQFAA